MALLSASQAPAPVFRARTEQFGTDECPAYNVWPVEERYDYKDSDHDSAGVTLRLRVQCLVSATSDVDTAAEPLSVFAQQQIMADESLGSLVQDIALAETKWTIAGAAQDLMAFDMDFEVVYQAARANPSVNAFYYSGGSEVFTPTGTPLALTAGVSVSEGMAVAVLSGAGVPADSGNVTLPAIGVATSGAVFGAELQIQYSGPVAFTGWSFTTGLPVFVGSGGVLTQTAPTSGYLQVIGYPLSPTTLLIDIQDPIAL